MRVSKKFFSFFRPIASDIHGNELSASANTGARPGWGAAAIGNEVHVLLAQRRVQPEKAARHGIAAIGRLQLRRIRNCYSACEFGSDAISVMRRIAVKRHGLVGLAGGQVWLIHTSDASLARSGARPWGDRSCPTYRPEESDHAHFAPLRAVRPAKRRAPERGMIGSFRIRYRLPPYQAR